MTLYTKLLHREKRKPDQGRCDWGRTNGLWYDFTISTIPGMIVSGISDINLEAANRAAAMRQPMRKSTF